jgi:general secretion pathway protein I
VSTRAGARGFTLLEVMVALAVLAGAMMALADLTGNALRNFAYARDLSVATVLARGKMAEVTEQLEDSGFRDTDQTEEGDFAGQGQPGLHWKLEVRKPDVNLTADQLLSAFLGSGPDDTGTQDLIGKLLGTGSARGTGSGGPSSGLPSGAVGGLLQSQLTAFAEELKAAVRRVRLTVSWKDGKQAHEFDVSTVMVVLNPRAPGGSRGTNPDIPPNLSAPASTRPGMPGAVPDPRAVGPRRPGSQP